MSNDMDKYTQGMSEAQKKKFMSLLKPQQPTTSTTSPSYSSGGSSGGGSSKSSKNSEVAIRDYINSYGKQYGISNEDIGWENGQVYLGGQSLITPSRIDENNRSWANQADIKSAIDAYAQNRGYVTQPMSVSPMQTAYQSPYGSRIDQLLRKLDSMPAFDPNSVYSSPEYKAMKNRLESQSVETSENVMADFASMTGGIPSSYAIAAAKESAGDIKNRLNEAIPGLTQAAYNRYLQEQGMTMDELNMLASLDNSGYQRFADQRNFGQGALESNRNYNQSNKQFEYSIERDKILDQRYMEQFNYQKQQDILANALQQKQISISERNAQLAKNKFEWEKDPTNPANMEDPETIGALYASMMSSNDPEKWLKDNAQYLTEKELKSLIGFLPRTSETVQMMELLFPNGVER